MAGKDKANRSKREQVKRSDMAPDLHMLIPVSSKSIFCLKWPKKALKDPVSGCLKKCIGNFIDTVWYIACE